MTSRDPGLQPERTALSWRRTQLSVMLAGLVVARLALADDTSFGEAVLVLAVVVIACALAIAAPRSRPPSAPLSSEAPTRAMAAAVTLTGLVELVAVMS